MTLTYLLKWSACDITQGDASSNHLVNLAATHKLRQINRIPNHRGVYLDLIFSSITTSDTFVAEDPLLPEERHHPAMCKCPSINLQKTRVVKNVRYIHLTTENVTWTQIFTQSKTSTFLSFPPHETLKRPSMDSMTIWA